MTIFGLSLIAIVAILLTYLATGLYDYFFLMHKFRVWIECTDITIYFDGIFSVDGKTVRQTAYYDSEIEQLGRWPEMLCTTHFVHDLKKHMEKQIPGAKMYIKKIN